MNVQIVSVNNTDSQREMLELKLSLPSKNIYPSRIAQRN